MSMSWVPPDFPGRRGANRGAAPVGRLDELPPLESGAVLALRQWCQDEDGRIAFAETVAAALGSGPGARAVNLLAHLVALMVGHGRRPFMRHDLACPCIGGDESVFAQMIAAATMGDTDDAMAFALTFLPADTAFEAVQSAGPFGRLILSVYRQMQGRPNTPHTPQSSAIH
jgi:hypothetical protein